jgi:hypothetical protein
MRNWHLRRVNACWTPKILLAFSFLFRCESEILLSLIHQRLCSRTFHPTYMLRVTEFKKCPHLIICKKGENKQIIKKQRYTMKSGKRMISLTAQRKKMLTDFFVRLKRTFLEPVCYAQ